MSEAPVLHERDLLVLCKLLGMLGPENPHERAAAGAKVHAWVTQRGLEWHALLIPDEPPEVEVEVNVGGRRATAGAKPAGGNGKGGGVGGSYQQAYGAHSQQQAAQAAATQQAASYAAMRQQAVHAARSAPQGGAQGQSWGHTTFPAWKVLAEKMLKDHPNLLKGSKENQFLADQIARALQYGSTVRISEKQQAWLRDILGRAGLTW